MVENDERNEWEFVRTFPLLIPESEGHLLQNRTLGLVFSGCRQCAGRNPVTQRDVPTKEREVKKQVAQRDAPTKEREVKKQVAQRDAPGQSNSGRR